LLRSVMQASTSAARLSMFILVSPSYFIQQSPLICSGVRATGIGWLVVPVVAPQAASVIVASSTASAIAWRTAGLGSAGLGNPGILVSFPSRRAPAAV
jgi:hypothetical protein